MYRPMTTRRSSFSIVSHPRWSLGARVLLVLLAGSAVVPPCLGDLPPWVEVGETMMEAQGCDAAFLGRHFGPDTGNLLQFTWSGDNEAMTFDYSLQPGTTYLGEPLSLSCAGTFDPNTSAWSWTSSGQRGDFSWQATGSCVPTRYNLRDVTVRIPILPLGWLDFHEVVDVWPGDDPPIMIWESKHTTTFTVNDVVIGNVVEGRDMAHTAPGELPRLEQFTWNLPLAMAEHDFSLASASDHYGSFHVEVAPEPATALPVILAVVALGRRR